MSDKVFQVNKLWFFTNDDMDEWEEADFINIKDYPDGNWPPTFPLDNEGPFRTREDAEAALAIRLSVGA